MVQSRAVLIFAAIMISALTLSACKSENNTGHSLPSGDHPASVESDSKQRNENSPQDETGTLDLTVRSITSDIACVQGDGPCSGNGTGLACLEPTGVLGTCAAGLDSATTCYCRRAPNLPAVAPGKCSSASGKCGLLNFGALCDQGAGRTAGYCAPSLFASNTCVCASYQPITDAVQTANGFIRDEIEGSDCNSVSSVAACTAKKKGHGCMMSNGSLGACAQSNANGSCQCVATTNRPLIAIGVRCSQNTDLNCRENNDLTWQGASCINQNKMTGVCVITDSANNNCGCATTTIPYFDKQRDTCSATNNTCYNLKIGDACAKAGVAGTCLLNNNNCVCATNSDISSVAPPAIASFSETSPSQVTVNWTDPIIPAQGFRIAWAAHPTTPPCTTGVDVGVAKTYTIPDLAPATVYNIAVCAYDGGGRFSVPANAQWTTPQIESGRLCAVIASGINLGGRSYNVYQDMPQLGSFNSAIKSLSVKPGCWLSLFSSSNYTGTSGVYGSGVTDASVAFAPQGSLACDCPSVDPAPVAGSFIGIGTTLLGGQKLANVGLEPNCSFRAEMQTDGNFVIYKDNPGALATVVWASNTARNNGARLVFQSDGVAVIFSTLNRSLWDSGTAGRQATRLMLRGDGRLAMNTGTNDWVWMANAKFPGCTHVNGIPETFVEVSDLTPSNITHNSAAISWTYLGQVPTDFTYKLSSPGAAAPENCVGGTVTAASSVELSNLVPNSQYHIRVCTKSNKQNLSVGVPVSFATKPAPIISNDVLDLMVSAKTDRTAGLTWRANNPPAAKYMVKIDKLPTAVQDCVGGVETAALSHQASGLDPETLYAARVCSLRSDGTFNTGVVIQFQTDAPPDLVSDVLGLNVSAKSKSGFTISWSPSDPLPAQYLVSINVGQIAPLEQCPGGQAQTETTKSFTALEAETEYAVRVCSVSSRGKVTPGVIIRVMTDPLVPLPADVLDLRLDSKADKTANFSWSDTSSVNAKYVVKLSEASAPNATYCEGGTVQLGMSYAATNLLPKTNYIIRVCGQSEIGRNSPGKIINFITDPERPYFGAGPWTNAANAVDINNDGFVSPLDVLVLINEINRGGSRALDNLGPQTAPYLYFDVNADGSISPLDVLIVINYINQRG